MILNIINEATTKFFIMVDFDLRIKVGRRGFLKHDISHQKTPPFWKGQLELISRTVVILTWPQVLIKYH